MKCLTYRNNNPSNIEIYITIDDYTTAKITMLPSQITDTYITELTEYIQTTFNLNQTTSSYLYNKLITELNIIARQIKQQHNINQQQKESLYRLYYKDTEHRRNTLKLNTETYRERLKTEYEQYTFTPQINVNTNKLFKRDVPNIHNRLYNNSLKGRFLTSNVKRSIKKQVSDGYILTHMIDENINVKPLSSCYKSLININNNNKQ
jgi:hypothetical protein